jgi:hypothetical protein
MDRWIDAALLGHRDPGDRTADERRGERAHEQRGNLRAAAGHHEDSFLFDPFDVDERRPAGYTEVRGGRGPSSRPEPALRGLVKTRRLP